MTLFKKIRLSVTHIGFTFFFYSIVLLISYIRSDIYPLELIVSFTPYLIVVHIIFLVVFTIWFVKQDKNLKKILIFLSSFLSLGFVTLLMAMWVYDYARTKPTQQLQGDKMLKIAFLNMHYSNTRYNEVSAIIKNIDPDIIGLAEVGNVDKILLSKHYPYTQIKKNRNYASLALFSKYPLSLQKENLTFAIPAEVTIDNKKLPLFVIHPYPPSTPVRLQKRNEELFKLSSYINYLGGKAIIVGDFNTSPWSSTFVKLLSTMPEMKNTARGQGLHATWGFLLAKVQIDHILVPKTFYVESFTVQFIPGSDHKLILVVLKI